MRNLTKVDTSLNEILRHTWNEIDVMFYLDGVKEYQNHYMWRDYDKFMSGYMLSRWWIFCNRN